MCKSSVYFYYYSYTYTGVKYRDIIIYLKIERIASKLGELLNEYGEEKAIYN